MYTVWDVETTIYESLKRKANPFDPDNWVVASGWRKKGGPISGDYFESADAKPEDWFTKLLEGTKILVGFNIKFDLLHALQDPHNYAAWKVWVADGGIVWDCQIAEYLLRGMPEEAKFLDLSTVSQQYGGDAKIDEVKLLWDAGVNTPDIDKDLLMRYLLGGDTVATPERTVWISTDPNFDLEEMEDGEGDGSWVTYPAVPSRYQDGDIGNTERIFLAQYEKARKVGQTKSILLNMGATLCIVEMELNGMHVDMDLALRLAEELTAEVEDINKQLVEYVPKGLPFEFTWTRTQLSALIFGGKIKYSKRMPILDEDGNQTYSQMTVTEDVLDDNGEPVIIKSGKNKGITKTRKVKVDDPDKPKSRLEDMYYAFPQMVKPDPSWETANAGVYSVKAEVIEELGTSGIPFLELYASMVAKTKDLTTYFITYEDKVDKEAGEKYTVESGMLTLVDRDSQIIHHTINQCATVTARFSAKDPNTQNFPRGNKSLLKSVFTSRYGRDGEIIQSDFSSLEVYIQALLTGDPNLIADLIKRMDMHCVRVSQTFGITYDEAVRLCKVEEVPLWVNRRTGAKEFSFQRAYGAGDPAIAKSTGLPLETVNALSAAEDERYPRVAKYYDRITAEINKSRYPTNRYVDHPDVPAVKCQLGRGHYRTPDNKLYTWDEHPSNAYAAKRGDYTSFLPTQIKNYPVQGMGAEFAKAAMWLAIREFYKRDNFGGLAHLINQVHDALYGDFHVSVSLEAGALLHACMEQASFFMEKFFGWPLPVKVPSDTTRGPSMMEDLKFEDRVEFDSLVAKFTDEIVFPYC